MGVVIKQSFWGTVITYLGVLVGYVNTLYFRAEYLTLEEIGLFTLVTAHAMMISPLSMFGTASVYIKFFPLFKKADQHQLFSYLFLFACLGNFVILLFGYLFKDFITARYQATAPEYIDFLLITGIVMFSNSLFELFFSYSRSIMKVLFASFIKEVYLRLGAMLLIIGYAFQWWSFDWAIYGLGGIYFLGFLMILMQLVLFHGFRFDFRMNSIQKDWSKNIVRFGGYAMLLSGSFAIYTNVSYDQITTFLGTYANGIFQTCFFIGAVVEMPRRNMAKVVGPILSTSVAENNLDELKGLYQRSSITMSIMGILLFIGIVSNLTDLFRFIPKGEAFSAGFWVVVYASSAKLVLMVTSFAGEIINFTSAYRYNLYFQILGTILLLLLNYLFLPIWGITGVGLAFLVSTSIYLLIRVVFVWYQYNMWPVTTAHLKLFIISTIVAVAAFWFKVEWHPLLAILVRSIATTVLFIVPIFLFKISDDFNQLGNTGLKWLRKRFS